MLLICLYQSANNLLFITVEEVDNRNLNHSICSRLLAQHGTSSRNSNLARKRRVVDAHIELETLILRLA